MPVQPLPDELVIAILEEAQYDDLVPRYKWLKRYCRVCRAWRPYAQRLLFHHVALLRGAAHCKAFINAVAGGPHADPKHLSYLRESVRVLGMVVDHQEIYAEVIALLPNLRELHVSLYHAFFRPEVLTPLARGPRIEVLRVRTHHMWPLLQLLSVYRSVPYLEIDCSSARDPVLEENWPAPPTQLRELRFTNLQPHPHGFLEWALSGPSKDTLEILQVSCPGLQLSQLAELGVGPRLRSLTIRGLDGEADLSSFAPALSELAVVTSHPLPAAIFYRLPGGLEHLALHDVRGEGHFVPIIDALAAYYERSEGALRVLSYHRRREETVAATEDTRSDARALYEFCRERDVEFRFFEPPYGHLAGERVPMEPVATFPRPVPMSSRRYLVGDESWASGVRPKPKSSFVRKVAKKAAKAFKSSIPPAALARPS